MVVKLAPEVGAVGGGFRGELVEPLEGAVPLCGMGGPVRGHDQVSVGEGVGGGRWVVVGSMVLEVLWSGECGLGGVAVGADVKASGGEGAGVNGSIAGARVIMAEVIPELGWTCAWGSGYSAEGAWGG